MEKEMREKIKKALLEECKGMLTEGEFSKKQGIKYKMKAGSKEWVARKAQRFVDGDFLTREQKGV